MESRRKRGYCGSDSAFSGIHKLVKKHLYWKTFNESIDLTLRVIKFYLKTNDIPHYKKGYDANARIVQQNFKHFREWFFEMIS